MPRLVAVAALLLAASPALAEEGAALASVPGVHEHDGLFLQVQGGPAYLDLFDAEWSIGGPGAGIHLAAGHAVARNLVLFGEVAHLRAWNLAADNGWVGEDTASDASMSLSYLGPGVVYYLGDSGYHLGGGVGLARLALDNGERSGTDAGVGLRLGLGKEWWVSHQLSLGVAFDFSWAAVMLPREAVDTSDGQAVNSYGLAFVATYQ